MKFDMLIDPTAEELASAIATLLTRSSCVRTRWSTLSLLDAAENLKIIGRAGVTVDDVDIEAASERGVVVCDAPNSNVTSAAEHTMALLLAAARHICRGKCVSVHARGPVAARRFSGQRAVGQDRSPSLRFGTRRRPCGRAGRGLRHEPGIGRDAYCCAPSAPCIWASRLTTTWRRCSRPGRLHHGAPAPHGEHARHVRRRRPVAAMKDGVVLYVNAARGGMLQHGRPGRFRGRRQDRGRGCGLLRGRALAPTRPCTSSRAPL